MFLINAAIMVNKKLANQPQRKFDKKVKFVVLFVTSRGTREHAVSHMESQQYADL